MAEQFGDRMARWKEQIIGDIRKRWWWVLIVSPLVFFVLGLIEDRLFGAANKYVDERALPTIKPSLLAFLKLPHQGLLGWVVVGFLFGVLALVGHAYWETRPANKKAITGTVDFVAIRMDMGDKIHISADWSEYSADIGAFCRMSVTANGRQRTVKRFIMEIREMKDGKAAEPPLHVADSERSIGEHIYLYHEHTTNSFGFAIVKDVREEMPDLAERLRMPLAPDTHAEGWIRFELRRVMHQLNNYHLTFYAVDANDQRHEIEAASVRFGDPMSEYVMARQR